MSKSKKNVTLIDGGMGMWLQKKGLPVDKLLWSARTIVDDKYHPTVVEAHKDYIEAGAEIIITNNYVCKPSYLQHAGLAHRYVEFTETSAKLAVQARNESGDPSVKIAGSLPPLTPSYRPESILELSEMEEQYTNIAGALEPFVDLFIIETMSASSEARAALVASVKLGKPIWLSFTVNGDGNIRNGETVQEAFDFIGPELLKHVSLLSFNCSTPEEVTTALQNVVKSQVVPAHMELGVYPNGFITLQEEKIYARDWADYGRHDLNTKKIIGFAKVWVELGATMIGGCCSIYPHHIRAFRNFLKSSAKL